jgi:hypothetical protein
MTRPKVVIEISDDESEDLEREQAGEQHIVKIEEEDALQQQTLDLGTNTLSDKDNATQKDSELEPDQPIRNDTDDSPMQGDEEASRASEESYWAREDSDSDEDDGDYETEPDDDEPGDEDAAFNDHHRQLLEAGKDSSGASRQRTPTHSQT